MSRTLRSRTSAQIISVISRTTAHAANASPLSNRPQAAEMRSITRAARYLLNSMRICWPYWGLTLIIASHATL